jgi:hypothetical protein
MASPGQLPVDPVVVPVHAAHYENEHGNRQYDHPGSAQELRGYHHAEHDSGDQRTETIDRYPTLPAGAAVPLPVANHAALRKGERDEDTDQVELNQPVEISVERNDQSGSRDRQDENPVREDEPVAELKELARHEAVLRQYRSQTGKVLVCGSCAGSSVMSPPAPAGSGPNQESGTDGCWNQTKATAQRHEPPASPYLKNARCGTNAHCAQQLTRLGDWGAEARRWSLRRR